ncbi:toll-like receptor 3 [Gouania willdenowi]|uniref:TIR domain-containing protein n=1 Tax=Gouania willdenowi TaxID=441366 RepID=A0A8C5G511_GOUWI|nr:toll-like receptor 3 [Gouania willdenowi]
MCCQPLLFVLCYFMVAPHYCIGSLKNNSCVVEYGRADCSHLSLRNIPSDLPWNITSLDMSHNLMVGIELSSLSLYPGIIHLNVSHNSIAKLNEYLCQKLPLLQTIDMNKNQVHLLKKEELSYCNSLISLNLASNRLKLQGEPFSALQKLKFLDVSNNNLKTAKLGSISQLPSLVGLNLAFNDFTTLKRDDFAFLNESSFLKVLNLSALSLKTFESGCFHPISGLHTLILDKCNMGTLVISKVCSELSETAIENLSLQKMKLVTLTNTTFRGLGKTNLTVLDLSSNGMGKIEDGSFRWLPRLQTLILCNNNLKHVTKGTFLGLKSLKNLQLMKALVKSHTSSTPIIDDFSFQPLSTLESLMLQKTAVREITENTFTGLTSLTELDMSWSSYAALKNITKKTFVSLSNSPLRTLNLIGTAITRINSGSFSFFGNLTTLLLDHNFIKQNLTGQEFEGLGQLQELYMANNGQSLNLTAESFVHTPNLTVLTLGKSLRAMALNLDLSAFQNLSKLNILDLSNNNIANIKENLLQGLVNLKVLRLQHNNLARLWKSGNLGGPVLFLKEAQKLTTLQLDYNGLDEIPLMTLKGLTHLKELSLSNNILNNFKETVFDDLTSLRVLRLAKNFITTVRPEVFRTPFTNLSLLMMEKNPYDCTCESILWFVTWLNSTNVTSIPGVRHQYMCNTPLVYSNRPVIDFDPSSCKDATPFEALFILSSTAVIILTLTALLVRFHGWRFQFYWNIMINRTLGFSDAKDKEGREFEFDAYIIHAAVEKRWVDRTLVPLEQKGYCFCLEHRDFIPGMSMIESIVSNLRKSRKIIFVITESLLNDPWCRQFKAHHAFHQVIEHSRDSVVLVFLQEVHDYKLSRALFLRRGMLRSCCLLDWPVYKERIPAFQQKLLIALGMTNQLKE